MMHEWDITNPEFWNDDNDKPMRETRSQKFWHFMFKHGFGLIFLGLITWGLISLYNSNEPERKAAAAKKEHMEQKPVVVYHGGIMTFTEHCDSVSWSNKNLNTWCDGTLRVIPSHRIKEIKYK